MSEDIKAYFGGDNVPFVTGKSEIPNYKSNSPRGLLPQQIRKARIDLFDLSKEEEYKSYKKIWEAVGLGVATVFEEDKRWVKSKENWKVFVRWCINAKMDPSELRSTRSKLTNEVLSEL